MAEIDDLERDVNNLSEANDIERFENTYERIKAAFLKAQTAAVFNRVRAVLRVFRNKIPDRDPLIPVRQSARQVDERLTSMAVATLLGNINNRSRAINDLKTRLDVEIRKGNRDATLLTRIREAIERASKTIAEINTLIDRLRDTPDDIVGNFKALLTTIGNVNDIFDRSEV